MKKVLIITYAFPPSNAAGMHRILRFGKWLPSYGWEPYILTTDSSYYYRQDKTNLKYVEKYLNNVYRCSSLFERTFYNLGNTNNRSMLARLFRVLVLRNLIPDKYITWAYSAYKKGIEIIDREKIDVIWATLGPATSGIIGSLLSKKTGLPLLVDYRDPWTLGHFSERNPFKRKLNIILENKMLLHASQVTTSSIPMRELFIQHKYIEHHNIHVITNGYDEELQQIEENDEIIDIDNKKINITYSGTFYRDRQPYSFINGLKILIDQNPNLINEIKVNFIGFRDYQRIIENYCNSLGIRKMFYFKGVVSYRNAMKYILSSDILLLINGESSENKIYIPAKLFDYLVVNKPILFIGEGQPADIIKILSIGEVANHSPNEIKDKLGKLILSRNNYQINNTVRKKYSSECIAKNLSEIFDVMVSNI